MYFTMYRLLFQFYIYEYCCFYLITIILFLTHCFTLLLGPSRRFRRVCEHLQNLMLGPRGDALNQRKISTDSTSSYTSETGESPRHSSSVRENGEEEVGSTVSPCWQGLLSIIAVLSILIIPVSRIAYLFNTGISILMYFLSNSDLMLAVISIHTCMLVVMSIHHLSCNFYFS